MFLWSRLRQWVLLCRAGRLRGWWGSMYFHHSAIAMRAKVHAFATCAQADVALCDLQFLTH